MKTIDRIRKNAELFPDRIAYRIRDFSLTYGSLWESASGLARALAQDPRPFTVLLGEKEPWMLIGMIGALLAGKTYIPIDASAPEDRILRILSRIESCRILSEGPVPDPLQAESVSELIGADGALPLTEDPSGEDGAYLLFTSGSTGEPKGVPISRNNLDCFIEWICSLEELRVPCPVRVLNQARFSFDLSVADLYYALCCGHTLIGLPSEITMDPSALQTLLETSDPTVAVCTPTFLKLCMLEHSFCAARLPSLRIVYSCGEVLEKATTAKLFDRFPDLCLINAYGPTETTSAVCAVRITRDMLIDPRPLPIGRLSTAACRIDVEEGEIVVKGGSVFCGYIRAENTCIYQENEIRCFRTGDFGYTDGDLLYFEGRKDRQIKWKGCRIELDEIEENIRELPGVTACAVTAARNKAGIVRFLRCFVCLEDPCMEKDLVATLRGKLPDYMLPKVIRRVEVMPVTENGKIDRKKLDNL